MTPDRPRRPETPLLRQGRTLRRMLYVQCGWEPDEDDIPIGMVDSAEIARVLVAGVNGDSDMRGRLRIAVEQLR